MTRTRFAESLASAREDGDPPVVTRWRGRDAGVMLREQGEVTDSEGHLCVAAAAGRVLDLRSREDGVYSVGGQRWEPQRTIRAVLLRQLLLGEESSASRPIAVRVRGARIVGPLNLGGQTLICPFEVYECYLGDPSRCTCFTTASRPGWLL